MSWQQDVPRNRELKKSFLMKDATLYRKSMVLMMSFYINFDLGKLLAFHQGLVICNFKSNMNY